MTIFESSAIFHSNTKKTQENQSNNLLIMATNPTTTKRSEWCTQHDTDKQQGRSSSRTQTGERNHALDWNIVIFQCENNTEKTHTHTRHGHEKETLLPERRAASWGEHFDVTDSGKPGSQCFMYKKHRVSAGKMMRERERKWNVGKCDTKSFEEFLLLWQKRDVA